MGNTALDSLEEGFRLENYEITKVLGRGGFGITYLAYDHDLDTEVAIKEFFPFGKAIRGDDMHLLLRSEEDAEMYSSQVERFIEEARALAQFNHQSIVRVRRLLELNDTAYFVMDFVRGGTLGEYIEAHGKVGLADLQKMARSLVDGLMVVHKSGVVHRDIKPDNILLPLDRTDETKSDLGRPILIDFGTARQTNDNVSATNYVSMGFAPIEQYTSRSVPDARSDIYALCAVLYASISGEVPADANTRQLEPESLVPAVNKFKKKLPQPFLEAIDAGLAILPNDRPASMSELKTMMFGTGSPDQGLVAEPRHVQTREVETIIDPDSSHTPEVVKQKKGLPLPLIFGGAAAASLFAVCGYLLYAVNAGPPEPEAPTLINIAGSEWTRFEIPAVGAVDIEATGPFRIRDSNRLYIIDAGSGAALPFSPGASVEAKGVNGPVQITLSEVR